MSVVSEINRISDAKSDLNVFLVSIGEAGGTERLDVLIDKAITIMSSYRTMLNAAYGLEFPFSIQP